MKVLVANLILYTSETREIEKANSIKDTMIYDLCLAFKKSGADVTLAASDCYKPETAEEYPFKIVWLKTKCKSLLPPHALPYCPDIKKLAKKEKFDLIISSEVFSLCSYMLARSSPQNLIIWQELAKQNRIFHGMASKLWYSLIAKTVFKNVLIAPRSEQAKSFISQYCKNVSDTVIDHGVNLEKFTASSEKKNYFAICSQLIRRKRIDKSITAFANYMEKYDKKAKLYIMGDGDERENLEKLCNSLNIKDSVIFTGKIPHSQLVEILKYAAAMLIYTESDLNMVTTSEAMAVATPIVTNSVPYNSLVVKNNRLGIVSDNWGADELYEIMKNGEYYISNCVDFRKYLPTEYKVKQFISLYENMNKN